MSKQNVTVTPRGDLTLVVDGVLPAAATADDVANLLATTCFDREDMTVGDAPLLEWTRQHLERTGAHVREALMFGRDVHQMVFPGAGVLTEIQDSNHDQPAQLSSVVGHIIYRGTVRGRAQVRTPQTLNTPDHSMAAHGRGVSVVAGWGTHVENSLALIALTLVSALGVVHRARRNAFAALSLNEQAMLVSAGDARSLVSRLSAKLSDLQLDLSFGVEAYVDSVLLPEVVVSSFQSSLVDAINLNEGLTNTSRMLDRLHSAIQARLSQLEAVAQEQEDRRSKVLSSIFAAGSLIALPPALLLAFFGANAAEVNSQDSLFDMSHYWLAYLLAWLPFEMLVLVGFVLVRRIRAVSPQLRKYETRPGSDRGSVDDLLSAQHRGSPADLG